MVFCRTHETDSLIAPARGVTRNGQLVLAHGYGLADQTNQVPVQPDVLMRIASCSTQFTSVAILQLVIFSRCQSPPWILGLPASRFAICSSIPVVGTATSGMGRLCTTDFSLLILCRPPEKYSRNNLTSTPATYEKLIATDPKAGSMSWQRMTRDAEVYARGQVRHPDHKTIDLDGWHRVHMNRERFARHAPQIALLD